MDQAGGGHLLSFLPFSSASLPFPFSLAPFHETSQDWLDLHQRRRRVTPDRGFLRYLATDCLEDVGRESVERDGPMRSSLPPSVASPPSASSSPFYSSGSSSKSRDLPAVQRPEALSFSNAPRMSTFGYGQNVAGTSRGSTEYAPGSGAEFMARQGWDRPYGGRQSPPKTQLREQSVGEISFYGKSSRRQYTILAFILLAILLIAAIAVIVLFVCGVFRPAIPEPTPEPPFVGPVRGDPFSSSSSPSVASAIDLAPPLFPSLSSFPLNPHPSLRAGNSSEPRMPIPAQVTVHFEVARTTAVPNGTSSPAIPLMAPPYYRNNTTGGPIVDRNENRTFAASIFVLQQANSAYDNPTSFAYLEAFRMISDAIVNLVVTSTLQQYNAVAVLESLRNSGDDLEVRFRIQLTVPSRSAIDIAVVRNVLSADMYKFEARLNQITVDQNRITVSRVA